MHSVMHILPSALSIDRLINQIKQSHSPILDPSHLQSQQQQQRHGVPTQTQQHRQQSKHRICTCDQHTKASQHNLNAHVRTPCYAVLCVTSPPNNYDLFQLVTSHLTCPTTLQELQVSRQLSSCGMVLSGFPRQGGSTISLHESSMLNPENILRIR